MGIAAILAELEPWFTFKAGIPPHRLAAMSLCQVADHLAFHRDMTREGGRDGR